MDLVLSKFKKNHSKACLSKNMYLCIMYAFYGIKVTIQQISKQPLRQRYEFLQILITSQKSSHCGKLKMETIRENSS